MIKIKDWDEGIGNLIDLVLEAQKKKQQDYLFLVGGTEGSGKSFTVLKGIEHIELRTATTVPIQHVAGSLKEFALAVAGKDDNQVFALDEGKELESTNWQDKSVKAFKKWITKNRIRSHIYFVCFPNPLSMLPYIRNDKLIAVLLMIKPGVCYVYSPKVFAKIVDELKQKRIKSILDTKPNFISRVPKYDGHLLKDYNLKKRKWTMESDDEFLDELGVTEKPLTEKQQEVLDCLKEGMLQSQIAKKLNIKPPVVTQHIGALRKKGYKIDIKRDADGIVVGYDVLFRD
jgi:hypothetical protein